MQGPGASACALLIAARSERRRMATPVRHDAANPAPTQQGACAHIACAQARLVDRKVPAGAQELVCGHGTEAPAAPKEGRRGGRDDDVGEKAGCYVTLKLPARCCAQAHAACTRCVHRCGSPHWIDPEAPASMAGTRRQTQCLSNGRAFSWPPMDTKQATDACSNREGLKCTEMWMHADAHTAKALAHAPDPPAGDGLAHNRVAGQQDEQQDDDAWGQGRLGGWQMAGCAQVPPTATRGLPQGSMHSPFAHACMTIAAHGAMRAFACPPMPHVTGHHQPGAWAPGRLSKP